eukprot:1140884-Pelagomonas_calceolata.AAC.3
MNHLHANAKCVTPAAFMHIPSASSHQWAMSHLHANAKCLTPGESNNPDTAPDGPATFNQHTH